MPNLSVFVKAVSDQVCMFIILKTILIVVSLKKYTFLSEKNLKELSEIKLFKP